MSKFFVAFYAAVVIVGALTVVGVYGTEAGQAANSELGLTLLNGSLPLNHTGS